MDVCEIVDELILRQDLPVRAGMRPIRAFDGLYPEGEEAETHEDEDRDSADDHARHIPIPQGGLWQSVRRRRQIEGAKNIQTLNIGGSGTTSVSFIIGT